MKQSQPDWMRSKLIEAQKKSDLLDKQGWTKHKEKHEKKGSDG